MPRAPALLPGLLPLLPAPAAAAVAAGVTPRQQCLAAWQGPSDTAQRCVRRATQKLRLHQTQNVLAVQCVCRMYNELALGHGCDVQCTHPNGGLRMEGICAGLHEYKENNKVRDYRSGQPLRCFGPAGKLLTCTELEEGVRGQRKISCTEVPPTPAPTPLPPTPVPPTPVPPTLVPPTPVPTPLPPTPLPTPGPTPAPTPAPTFPNGSVVPTPPPPAAAAAVAAGPPSSILGYVIGAACVVVAAVAAALCICARRAPPDEPPPPPPEPEPAMVTPDPEPEEEYTGDDKRRCRKGHLLAEFRAVGGEVCVQCEVSKAAASVLYGCAPCDYQVCAQCRKGWKSGLSGAADYGTSGGGTPVAVEPEITLNVGETGYVKQARNIWERRTSVKDEELGASRTASRTSIKSGDGQLASPAANWH